MGLVDPAFSMGLVAEWCGNYGLTSYRNVSTLRCNRRTPSLCPRCLRSNLGMSKKNWNLRFEWENPMKIIYKYSFEGKKHLLLGELCVVVFDWTYPKACENSCEWIPGDTGATSTCPWKMGLQPAYAILAKLRQSKCPCPQNSRGMTMEPSASKDDSMSLLWDTRHKVYKVYLEVQLGLWKVITMVTTSTSWDVTPTTHGDVVIWPTVEHGLWSNISQVIGYMLILKINENPSPYLKWCMKMVWYNQHTKKNPGGGPVSPSNRCIEICISCWKQCRVFMKILGCRWSSWWWWWGGGGPQGSGSGSGGRKLWNLPLSFSYTDTDEPAEPCRSSLASSSSIWSRSTRSGDIIRWYNQWKNLSPAKFQQIKKVKSHGLSTFPLLELHRIAINSGCFWVLHPLLNPTGWCNQATYHKQKLWTSHGEVMPQMDITSDPRFPIPLKCWLL